MNIGKNACLSRLPQVFPRRHPTALDIDGGAMGCLSFQAVSGSFSSAGERVSIPSASTDCFNYLNKIPKNINTASSHPVTVQIKNLRRWRSAFSVTSTMAFSWSMCSPNCSIKTS